MIRFISGPNKQHSAVLRGAWRAYRRDPTVIASDALASDNRHYYEVKSSALHGTGCFAAKPIPKGTVLISLSPCEFQEDCKDANQIQCVCRVQSKAGKQHRKVDGGITLRGDAYFVNHSCVGRNVMYCLDYKYIEEPQRVGKPLRHYMPIMAVIALDDIPAGSELLVDYFTNRSRRGVSRSTPGAVPCRCQGGHCPRGCYLMGP